MLERRKFLTGLISLVAAPAIVRAGSLMPVKADPINWRYVVRRVDIDISEVYGRSPAMTALPQIAWREVNMLDILGRNVLLDDLTALPVQRRTEGMPSEQQ